MDLEEEGLEGQLTGSSSGIGCGVVTTIAWPPVMFEVV
jgi:hypothetical protein